MGSWDYWFVFPYAVIVAIFANASGFSGAVLFQSFVNFALGLPAKDQASPGALR